MRTRADLIGLVVGVLLIGVVCLPWLARTFPKHSRTECANHLKDLYIALEVSTMDGMYLMESKPMSQVDGSKTRTDLELAFTVLCSNGLARAEVRCPRDDGKMVPRPSESLSVSNLSYFLSRDLYHDDPEWIIAGNRHVSAGAGAVALAQTGMIGWHSEMGLHGTNGFLLLRSGAVRVTDTNGLFEQVRRVPHDSNVVVVP